ncbi:MAG: copper chaperone PCu(A)C [Gammaproteobacteria bacterium]|nr:copper chaperone PCu(A)C [Gammaproteobacteria bacterium]MCP5136963.1 copper chaperone PCu(A)C [Gammaproteobacteria bacterium]
MSQIRFTPLARIALALTMLATISSTFASDAASEDAGTVADRIVVLEPYARAMPPMQPTSAMFLSLKNTDGVDHALVAATSDVARSVELHTHIMEDGVARMRQVEKIDLPASATASLAPGGFHVMLIGLHGPLVEGRTMAATLHFEDGSTKAIEVPIRGLSYRGKSEPAGGMKCGTGKCGGSMGGMKCGGGKCGSR